jgi:hypothetical protein
MTGTDDTDVLADDTPRADGGTPRTDGGTPCTDGGTADGGSSVADVARDRPDASGSSSPGAAIPTLGTREGVLGTLLSALGRTQLSALVAGLATLLVALLVGQQLLGTRLTLVALAAGGTLALGLYALNSSRLHVLLAGGALMTPAGVLVAAALAVGVGFALQTARAVGHLAEVTVLLLVLGSFAAVVTAVPLGEREVIGGAFMRFIGMLVPLTVLQLLVVTVVAWETVAVFLATLVLDSPDPLLAVGRTLLAPRGSTALLTFLVYAIALLYLARSLIGALPIVNLFPPRQRPEIASQVETIRTQFGRALLVVGVLSFAGYLAALVTGVAAPAALAQQLPAPLDGVVFALLTATWLRAVFLTLLGALLAVLVGERLRRRVRRLSEADLLRLSMPPIGAAVVAFVAAIGVSAATSPAQVLSQLPSAAAATAEPLLRSGLVPATLLLVFGSLIALGALFVLLTVVIGTPVVPERALGPALASTAVFALALVLVLFGGSPALAFLAAVVAMVVWDTGEYAVGLREELGFEAVTARGELVHIGGSLVVGLLVLVVAFALQLFVTSEFAVASVPDTTLAAGALTLAFLTTVVLVSALRE